MKSFSRDERAYYVEIRPIMGLKFNIWIQEISHDMVEIRPIMGLKLKSHTEYYH